MAKATHPRRNRIHEMPEGLGPYECWIFGAGKQYASRLQKPSRYLTALAELQRPQKTYTKLRRIAGKSGTKIWLPTLWKKDKEQTKQPKKNAMENDPFVLRFVPFIIGRPAKLAKVVDDPAKLRSRLLGGLRE